MCDTLLQIRDLQKQSKSHNEQIDKLYTTQQNREDTIRDLQIQYIIDNKLLSGNWLLSWKGTFANSELCDKYFEDLSILVDLIVEDGIHEYFYIPWGKSDHGNVSLGFDDGEIRIHFSGMSDDEIFDFLKKTNISVQLGLIDQQITIAEQSVVSLHKIKEMFEK